MIPVVHLRLNLGHQLKEMVCHQQSLWNRLLQLAPPNQYQGVQSIKWQQNNGVASVITQITCNEKHKCLL